MRRVGLISLALFAATTVKADLLLQEMGGTGGASTANKPVNITITSAVFPSPSSTPYAETDIPIPLIMNGWTADVTFNTLGNYGGNPPSLTPCAAPPIPGCVNSAFPTWDSANLFATAPTFPVTRPGFDASGNPTTISDTVSFTSYLRNPYPLTSPAVGTSGSKSVIAFVLSKYIFANDHVTTSNWPANIYYDGSGTGTCPGTGCSAANATVPVSNNSSRAYPPPTGAWVTEPMNNYTGASNAVIEFFVGHNYAQGNKGVAAVKIIMGDGGYAVTANSSTIIEGSTTTITISPPTSAPTAGAIITDTTLNGLLIGIVQSFNSGTNVITLTAPALNNSAGANDALNVARQVSHLATLGQSTRIPSTSCTATNGSNVLQNCGSIAWVKPGQRINVPGVPGQPIVGQVDTSTGGSCTTAPCIELYAQEYATFNTDGSLTITNAQTAAATSNGGGAVTANQTLPTGTQTIAVTGVSTRPQYGSLVYDVTAAKALGTVSAYTPTTATTGTINLMQVTTNAGTGSNDALVLSLPPGLALADGGFLGQTITELGTGCGGSLCWSSATKTIVAPYGTSADANTTGTAMTMPTPVGGGQWRPNMFIYDSVATATPSSSCLPLDVNNNGQGGVANEYIATMSGTTSATLGITLANAPAPKCTIGTHVISGLGVASNNITSLAIVSSVDISTTSGAVTGGSDGVQFNHNFVGTSGSVVVTSNSPIPVWAATFVPADFTNFTAGPLYFQALAYPVVGDQVLDTRTPMFEGNQVQATGTWTTSATALPVNNCAGINFFSSLSIEAVDITTGANLGIAKSCIGTTLTLASAATSASYGSADTLAIGPNLDCDWFYLNVGPSLGFVSSGHANGIPQSCTPSSPAWFGGGAGSWGVTNAQRISVNLHNLPAYYDPTSHFTPIYAWVGSAGSCTVQTTSTDPGSGSYCSTVAAAITAIKAANNVSGRGLHNDVQGGVFCLTPTATPTWIISSAGAPANFWTPGPTFTGAHSGSPCPAPGVLAPYWDAAIKENTTSQFWWAGRVQNLTVTNTGANSMVLYGGDSNTNYQTGFLTDYAIFDNDIISPNSGGNFLVYKIGAMYAYDLLDREYPVAVLKSNHLGNVVAWIGDTVFCQTYGNATSSIPFTVLGTMSWDCPWVNSTSAMNSTPWPTSQAIAFNRMMGYSGGNNPLAPNAVNVPNINVLVGSNVVEKLHAKDNGQVIMFAGDAYIAPGTNSAFIENTAVGSRSDMNYIEGYAPSPRSVTSAASLFNGSLVYHNIGYSRVTNPGVVTSIDTSTANGSFNNATNTPTANTQVINWPMPCDFTELATFYADYSSGSITGPINHLADVGAFTISASGSTITLATITGNLYVGATLASGSAVLLDNSTNCAGAGCPLQIGQCPSTGCNTATGSYQLGYWTLGGVFTPQTPATALSTGTTYYAQATQLNMCQTITLIGVDALTVSGGYASGGHMPTAGDSALPNKNYFKTLFIDRFNIFPQPVLKADFYTSTMPNGGRIGNIERRFGIDVVGDVYMIYNGYGQYQPTAWQGEIQPLGAYSNWFDAPAAGQDNLSAVRWRVGDDRSSGVLGGATTVPYPYPANDLGEGDYCPTTSTTVPTTTATMNNKAAMVGRLPATGGAWSIDIEGNPRSLTGWPGAYESTCK